MTLIEEPRRMNPLLRLGVRLAERTTGRRMLPARLLAWYPRAAVGSGLLESLVAHREPSPRLLKIVRITPSLVPQCAFCVDMNGYDHRAAGLTDDELDELVALATSADDPGRDPSSRFDERELLAIAYARRISSTPLSFPTELMADLRAAFTERELVILASTAAQVNYWARLIQGLGIPPAGFGASCQIPSAS